MKLKVNRFYKTLDGSTVFISKHEEETGDFCGVVCGEAQLVWFHNDGRSCDGVYNSYFHNLEIVEDITEEHVKSMLAARSKKLSEFLFDAPTVWGKKYPIKVRLPTYEPDKYLEILSGEARDGMVPVYFNSKQMQVRTSWVDIGWEDEWEFYIE